jgi:hypothetical protein
MEANGWLYLFEIKEFKGIAYARAFTQRSKSSVLRSKNKESPKPRPLWASEYFHITRNWVIRVAFGAFSLTLFDAGRLLLR